MVIDEVINITITHKYMPLKSEFLGLNKKIENATKTGFRFNEILKLTKKFDSNLSGLNIHYYSRMSMPIMHLQFFRIISEKPEYLKTFCNDLNILFHFPCHRWIFMQPINLKNSYEKFHFNLYVYFVLCHHRW